jgi:hypothetical protein
VLFDLILDTLKNLNSFLDSNSMYELAANYALILAWFHKLRYYCLQYLISGTWFTQHIVFILIDSTFNCIAFDLIKNHSILAVQQITLLLIREIVIYRLLILKIIHYVHIFYENSLGITHWIINFIIKFSLKLKNWNQEKN